MEDHAVPRLVFEGSTLNLRWPQAGAAVVTLTCTSGMNTLTPVVIDELNKVMELAAAGRASCLIITGSDGAFCVGANLHFAMSLAGGSEDWAMRLRDRFLEPLARVFDRLEEMPYPVIAAINGYALGGGCELALSADFRIMGEDAWLGLPEVRIGATPGAGGVQKLIRHVGRSKAIEWILLGSRISASEARAHGLVYRVVAPHDLMTSALVLAADIEKLGPCAIAQAKASVYLSEDADLRTARRFGIEALTLLATTPEWREGVSAFIEKREPNFR